MERPIGAMVVVAALFLAAGCGGGGTMAPTPTPVASPVHAGEQVVPLSSGFADANGVRLYYEVYGEGEPLLLIPGLSMNHRARVDEAIVYSGEFRAIIFDPRGTGDSSFPEGVDVSMALMADDATALLDALGIDAAHVYGLSEGGMVALEMALRHPEKVRSLVLGGTTAGGPESVPAEQWAIEAVLGTKGLDPLWTVMVPPDYLAQHRQEIADYFSYAASGPGTPPQVTVAQMRAIAAHDTYDRLADIVAPTLVLHGSDDPLVPVANARVLAERIPGAELVVFEGTRHSYKLDKAAESQAAVLEFLRSHPQEAE